MADSNRTDVGTLAAAQARWFEVDLRGGGLGQEVHDAGLRS